MDRLAEGIANAVHGSDRIGLVGLAKGLAQSGHMDINRSCFDSGIPAPNAINKGSPCPDLAGGFDQGDQHDELSRSKVYQSPCAAHTQAFYIKHDVVKLEYEFIRDQCSAPSHPIPDPVLVAPGATPRETNNTSSAMLVA